MLIGLIEENCTIWRFRKYHRGERVYPTKYLKVTIINERKWRLAAIPVV